jgi:hypothetical protein
VNGPVLARGSRIIIVNAERSNNVSMCPYQNTELNHNIKTPNKCSGNVES